MENRIKAIGLAREDYHEQGFPPNELGTGYFERTDYLNNRITISGWMLHPDIKFDSYRLYIDKIWVAENEVVRREDVGKVFPFIAHAADSGFSFSFHNNYDKNKMMDICVVGCQNRKKVAKIETWYQVNFQKCFPTPSPHLISRVAAHEDPSFYLVTGMKNFRDFWETAYKYVNPRSMLDWGCGPGRVTCFFSRFSGIPKIYGCDIDAEAVKWASTNLNSVDFSVISPFPPTHYADESFDLITSFSVLTHLSKKNQSIWLNEMKRLLKPDGLFLASIHGENATYFNFRTIDILKEGIYELKDDRLDGVAPDGYYLGTFQSKKYTMTEWGKIFEIIEYKEKGAGNYQDLVVMRRRQN